MVPTSYKVTPASPTIDRPGSIPISGASIPRTLISDFIASVISLIPLSIGKLSSPSTYLIPKPPPRFNNSTWMPCSLSQRKTILAVSINASVPSICEPIWQCTPFNFKCLEMDLSKITEIKNKKKVGS